MNRVLLFAGTTEGRRIAAACRGRSLELHVSVATEYGKTLIEPALGFIKDKPAPRVLDLCCGSGAIGIAILMHNANASCVFADLSAAALRVCRRNLQKYELSEDRAQTLCLDAMEPPPASLGQFDLIVCNPPYISAEEMNALPVDVAGFEPNEALYGGYDGLSFYRAICAGFRPCLKTDGHILFEHGAYQSFDVCQILQQNRYTDIKTYEDLNTYLRAVSAGIA